MAKHLPGFHSPRFMYCSEFNEAMRAVVNIIKSETPLPEDARARVEMLAQEIE